MNTAYSHYAADVSWKIMQTELTLVVICIHLLKLNIFASLQLITSVFLSYPLHKVFVYKCTVFIHILDRFHVSSTPDAPRWTTPTFREPKLPFSFLSLHTIAPSRYNQRRPFTVRHYMIIAWPYHYVAFRILQYRTISMGTPFFLKHQLSKPPSHVRYKNISFAAHYLWTFTRYRCEHRNNSKITTKLLPQSTWAWRATRGLATRRTPSDLVVADTLKQGAAFS